MIHKFQVKPIDENPCYAKVSIDGQNIRCSGYKLEHYVDCVPRVYIEVPIIPEIKENVIVHVANKEEIARLMDLDEFEEFQRIWNEVHKE